MAMDGLLSRRRLGVLTAALAVAAFPPAAGAKAKSHQGGSVAVKRSMATANPADRGKNDGQDNGEGTSEIIAGAMQYQGMRVAPAAAVSGAAFVAAAAESRALPEVGGPWTEQTNQAYQSDDPRFRDPVWSNSGGGANLVSGRMTALVVDPANADVIYAGAADGGVWRSPDRGATWEPLMDGSPSLSIGSLAVNPVDGSVWIGTGEANTNADSYKGIGVLRCAAPCGPGSTFATVGGSELDGTTIGQIAFSPDGQVYAATTLGLWSRQASDLVGAWTLKLNAAMAGYTPRPYGDSIVTDVKVEPGTNGRVVLAAMAWRSGATYNGFYESTDGGMTFSQITPTGDINAADIGRTTFAWSSDGSKLYAIVQSVAKIQTPGAVSLLQGVYRSDSGNPVGPWTSVATWQKLVSTGSAQRYLLGYKPGIQAWYNQSLIVDPANANHVYMGLEELYETKNGGNRWQTIGPYWNFNLPCYVSGGPDACPDTTHSDQHALAVGGGLVYAGNDGGIWSRSLGQDSSSVSGWNDLNLNLHTLQYYGAGAGVSDRSDHGFVPGDVLWGGMQDNGASLLFKGSSPMVQPFGGDGGFVIVDPADAQRAVVEYTSLDMVKTHTAGYSPNGTRTGFEEITPSCFANTYHPNPCDPLPRFIAPYVSDIQNIKHWVAGGRYVWDNLGKGWKTRCSSTDCTWKPVWDTMSGATVPRSVTALADSGPVTWAAWCAPGTGCNPSELSSPPGTPTGFSSGIDTNYDPTHAYAATKGWHHLDSAALGLPNRYITSIAIDPASSGHVYVVFGGFGRHWIPAELGPGVGHVYESTDGGLSFHDVSGDLPDVPADDLLIAPDGNLVLGTDLGVYVAPASDTSHWSLLGSPLPNAAVDDLAWGPGDSYVIAATHGRGLWSIPTP
jgi:hypothetical protein